jgi:hypothetical protein
MPAGHTYADTNGDAYLHSRRRHAGAVADG